MKLVRKRDEITAVQWDGKLDAFRELSPTLKTELGRDGKLIAWEPGGWKHVIPPMGWLAKNAHGILLVMSDEMRQQVYESC
jgi:hypothetical protein